MADTILASDFAVQIVYPFLLVFVIIFAILQRSEILGKGKKQIDALVALAIALIVVTVGWATNIITILMPFLAIAVVVLLVLFILMGFVSQGDFEIPEKLKYALWAVAFIFVIIIVIFATGQWPIVRDFLFKNQYVDNFWGNFLLIAIIAGAIAAVLFGGKGGESERKPRKKKEEEEQ